MSAPQLLRARLAEANPVLIKDLRQALRGRLFRSAFLLTLMVATVVAATTLANVHEWNRNSSGSDLFFGLTVAFVLISFLVAPVLANRAMAAEREPALFDALALTNLAPARIITGKFQSSLALTLLILLAFLPAFAAAATLYGLDLVVAFAVVLATLAAGAALNLLGIWAACVAGRGIAGNLMLGPLLIVLGGSSAAWIGLLLAFVFGLRVGAGMALGAILLSLACVTAMLCGLAYWVHALCAWLLSHAEHPDVTRPRRAAVVVTILGALIALLAILQSNVSGVPGAWAAALMFLVTCIMVPHLCERDGLGRRAELELRAGARKSFLFLPGGAGATLLWLLLLAGAAALALMPTVKATFVSSGPGRALPLAMLAICLALGGILPVLAGKSHSSRVRWVVLTYAALPICTILHALLGVFGGSPESNGYWSLSPVGLIGMTSMQERAAVGLAFWCALGGLGLLFALARVQRGHRLVQDARRAGASARA